MATELGKAYVQIIPSAKGISGKIKSELGGEMKGVGESVGKSFGGKIIGAIKGVIVAAGIGKALSASITEGANLEQSIGGVETLFKESADKVIQNAKQAYKTAGVSANEYMEGVNSFAASLLQSTAGNTEQAANTADMAFRDMSDNANKMGSNMQDIQNAYQGFSKANYTMLDNLKLGYGGTKSEMERLLADAEKLSGVKYDINNLKDVYEAIHVVQNELGITGTTAKEAMETVSGSLNTLKAAFSDALGSLALGENVKESMQALAESLSVFVFDNLLPMIGTLFQSLPEGIVAFISTFLPIMTQKGGELITYLGQGIMTALPQIVTNLSGLSTGINAWVQTQLPILLQHGVSFIKGFISGFLKGMPEAIQGFGQVLANIVSAIMQAIPQIIQAGAEIILALAKGLIEHGPEILTAIGEVLKQIIKAIQDNLPAILEKGKELIGKLTEGIKAKKDEAVQAIKSMLQEKIKSIQEKFIEFKTKGQEIVNNIKQGITNKAEEVVNAFKKLIEDGKRAVEAFKSKFFQVGSDIINGLAKGIANAADAVKKAVFGVVDGAINWVKNKFGIHSPSRVFADEVGKWIPAGMAIGIVSNLGLVKNAVSDMEGLADNEIAKNIKYNPLIDGAEFITSGITEQNGTTPFKQINLNIGGQVFKAFVDRVSLEQGKTIDLELAY